MSAIEQQDNHRPPSDGGMAKEEFIRVGTTLYKIVEQPRRTEVCEETHRMEQRDPATGLRQGLHRQRSGMTASAPYPNTSATVPWSASSLTSMNR